MSSVFQSVAPTQTPVSIDDVKAKLRIEHNDDDGEIERCLKGAIDYCQEYQWAQYCTATFVERFDRFPCVFRPQRCPLLTVTSLAYVDTAGQTQTLTVNTHYTVDIYSKPGRIVPSVNYSWPATYGHVNDVTLTYTAGYGAAAAVPDEIKQALIMKTAQFFEACEDGGVMSYAIHTLLDKRSFRVFY